VQKMTLNWRIGLGVLVTILLVGGAFLFEQITKVQGSQNGELIPVMENSKIVAYLDSGTIKQLNIQERALRKDKSNIDGQNEASLDFVLGSAGIVNCHNVRVFGVADDEGSSFSSGEIAVMTLSPNANGTMALVDKSDGNHVKIKEVRNLLIEN